MKYTSYLVELTVSLAVLVLLVLLLEPFDFMPTPFLMMAEVVLIVLFGIFASFVWNERAEDEREELHRMLAARVAFLVGSGTLLLGIIVQSLSHALDSWLVFALVAMVLAKMAGSVYGRMRR